MVLAILILSLIVIIIIIRIIVSALSIIRSRLSIIVGRISNIIHGSAPLRKQEILGMPIMCIKNLTVSRRRTKDEC